MVTLFVVGLDFGHIWTLKPNSSSRSSELLLYNCHSSPPQFFRVAQTQKFKLLLPFSVADRLVTKEDLVGLLAAVLLTSA